MLCLDCMQAPDADLLYYICPGAMNKEAANSLLHHAVPVLELGVKWCHFDTGRLLQLLQQLAFAEVWTAPTLAFDGSPSPAQKARHSLP